jgi:hypothetical protein
LQFLTWNEAAAKCCSKGLRLISFEDHLVLETAISKGMCATIAFYIPQKMTLSIKDFKIKVSYFIDSAMDYFGTSGVWVNAAVESGTGDILWCPKDKGLVIRNQSQCALSRLINGKVQISRKHCTEKAKYVCMVRNTSKLNAISIKSDTERSAPQREVL